MLLKRIMLLAVVASFATLGCAQKQVTKNSGKKNPRIENYIDAAKYKDYGVATFAGGCFWCTEAAFERIDGVVDVISGYSGGPGEHPTYQEIGTGRSGHAEAIQIYFDKSKIDYAKLLEVLFVAHDPTTLNYQGPDHGTQYRSHIFYRTDAEKALIEAAITNVNASGRYSDKVVTKVTPYEEFWVAEDYHQDYYELHPENPYVQRISKPKVEKVKKEFKDILKQKYKKG